MAIVKLIIIILLVGLILFMVIALLKIESMNRNIKAKSKALQENIDKINKQLDEIESTK